MPRVKVFAWGAHWSALRTDSDGRFAATVQPRRGRGTIVLYAFHGARVGWETVAFGDPDQTLDIVLCLTQVNTLSSFVALVLIGLAQAVHAIRSRTPRARLGKALTILGCLGVGLWYSDGLLYFARNVYTPSTLTDCFRTSEIPETIEPGTCIHLVPRYPDATLQILKQVHVKPRGTLRIEPGSTVYFAASVGIFCEGTIQATGTPDKEIVFTAVDPISKWGHIALHAPQGPPSEFSNCAFMLGNGQSYKTPSASAGESEELFGPVPHQSRVGGAMLMYKTPVVTLSRCRFLFNRAEAGGAIYLRNGSNAHFEDCEFLDNQATECTRLNGPGGAIYIRDSHPTFARCTFRKNRATDPFGCGGAIYQGNGSSCELTNCTFAQNEAGYVGGAVYAMTLTASMTDRTVHKSKLTARICGFSANRSWRGGGALFVDEGSEATIAECRFVSNVVGTQSLSRSIGGTRPRWFGGPSLCVYSGKSSNPATADVDGSLWFGNAVVAEPGDSDAEAEGVDPVAIDYAQLNGQPSTNVLRIKRRLIDSTAYRVFDGKRAVDTIVIHHISAANWFDRNFHNLDCSKFAALEAELHLTEANIGAHRYDPSLCIATLECLRLSSHYLVARDGDVFQLVGENDVAFHAGRSVMPNDGRVDVNGFSIGIELVSSHPDDDQEVASGRIPAYTEKQYESLDRLLCLIRSRHAIHSLVGHDEIAGDLAVDRGLRTAATKKKDPGPFFEWSRVRDGSFTPTGMQCDPE